MRLGKTFAGRLVGIIAVITGIFAALCVSASAEIVLEYDGAEHVYTGSLYDLEVNDSKVDTPLEPILFNDRALVPIREVFEALGATVSYTTETQTVEVVKDSTYVRMTINDNTAYVNGVKTSIPDNVVPKLISKKGEDAKTMVPVRFVSEEIGLDVEFLGEIDTISVKDPEYEATAAAPSVEVIEAVTEEPTAEPAAEPTEAPTEAPTAATASPNAAATETAATEEPTTAVSAETLTVNSITAAEKNGGCVVTISANRAFEYSDFTLTVPNRIVIDIAGAAAGDGVTETETVNIGNVTRIRTGDTSERLRIVLDVSELCAYTPTLSADGTVLTVTVATSSDIAAATPTPTATPAPTAKPTSTSTSASTVTATEGEKLIYIDAGHGGSDPGAIGELESGSVNEKDLTLSIAKKVQSILEANGYKTAMTRTGDTYPTLTERADMANDANATVFVSIHINAHEQGSDANGIEVYYCASNNELCNGTTSEELATNVYDEMIAATNATERGVKTANHAVTRRSNMPAILVEVGFITNVEECSKMVTDSYQTAVANAIAKGIMETVD